MGFFMEFLIFLVPGFYLHYWYVALMPLFAGIGFGLYRKKWKYPLWGLLLTLPLSILGSALILLNWKP